MQHKIPGSPTSSIVSPRLRVAILASAVLLAPLATAASEREQPRSFTIEPVEQLQMDRREMPYMDNERLLATARASDARRAEDPAPRRFAEPIDATLNLQNSGTWEVLADGSRLWRLRIYSAGATSLNLGLTTFELPPGAKLWLYGPDREIVQGPFTREDRSRKGRLWTPIVRGDEVIVELHVPAVVDTEPAIEIGKVNHAFRDFVKSGADKQGSCNNDVICPEGDPWRDQIRSVGMYSLNGADACSGQLVNNTDVDFTPYFLTANHCGITTGNDDTMVVYWNYESVNCGDLSGGDLTDNQMGAILRASYAPSDFALVELDDDPAPASNVYFTGWDATPGVTPGSAVAIHHPSTDEKAISFENQALTSTNYLSNTVNAGANHWRVIDWDDGTTEPGSSGSCLWNPANKRCVGQLHGGYAACGNNESDWYGKLSVSWEGGGTDSTRLRNWLNPANDGTLSMHGDPHITTLDGTHYDFQGAGEYVVLRDGADVEVQARQAPIATTFNPGPDGYHGLATCVSLNSAVAARVGGRRVTYQPNLSGVPDPSGLQLRLDGTLTTLGPGGIDLGNGGRITQTSAPGGLEIAFPEKYLLRVTPGWWTSQSKWYLNISVIPVPTVGGASPGATSATGGLGGRIVPQSWLPALPDGSSMGPMPAALHDRYVDLYQVFGEAWRVTDATSLFDYATGDSTATFTLKTWPMENPPCKLPHGKPVAPVDLEVAQEACARIREGNLHDDCVFDVRVTGEQGFATTYWATQQLADGLPVDDPERHRFAVSFHLGYPFALADLDDAGAEGKGAAALDWEWRFAPRRSLEFVLGRYAFEIDPGSIDVDIDGFSAYYKAYSASAGSPRLFWQLGPGAFDVQPGLSTQGVSGGLGWQSPITPSLEFEVAGMLFHLFSTGVQPDLDFALAQAGFKLTF
jgi:hypothetical protein